MIRRYNSQSNGDGQVFDCSRKCRRLRLVGFTLVLLAFTAGVYCDEEGTHTHDHESAATTSEQAQTTNVICPVMTGKKVDPNIFTDYQGRRVYFCCLNCRAAFGKDPEKYLPFLPQFGGAAAEIAHDNGNHGGGLTLPGLVKPVGIATLSCLVLTVAAALLRRKNPKVLFKWHKRLGVTTLVLAVMHLTLVLIAH